MKKSIKYCFNNNYFEFDKKLNNSYVTFVMLTVNNFSKFNYLDLSKKLKITAKEYRSSLETLFIGENKLIFILEDKNTDESYKILINIFRKLNQYYSVDTTLQFNIASSALNLQYQELNDKYNKNLYSSVYKFLKRNISRKYELIIVNKF